MRGIDIFGSPFIISTATAAAADQVPAQICNWNNLRGNARYVDLRPDGFPGVAFSREIKVAYVFDRTDGCTPMQTNSHLSLIVGDVQGADVEAFEC